MKAFTSSPQDQFACGGACYPNGKVVLILAQICLFVGLFFSTMTLFDCEFIVADIDVSASNAAIPSILTGLVEGDNRRRGLGFLIHQNDNGSCHWKDHEETRDSDQVADYTEAYLDWLGSDWDYPRRTAITASVCSLLLFVWMLAYSRVAHPKWLRYAMAVLVIVLLTILQYLSFGALDSDFCQGRQCEMGRSGGFSVAAGIFFIVTGVLCFFSKDYPGKNAYDENEVETPPPQATVMMASDAQQETQIQEVKADPEAHIVSVY